MHRASQDLGPDRTGQQQQHQQQPLAWRQQHQQPSARLGDSNPPLIDSISNPRLGLETALATLGSETADGESPPKGAAGQASEAQRPLPAEECGRGGAPQQGRRPFAARGSTSTS